MPSTPGVQISVRNTDKMQFVEKNEKIHEKRIQQIKQKKLNK